MDQLTTQMEASLDTFKRLPDQFFTPARADTATIRIEPSNGFVRLTDYGMRDGNWKDLLYLPLLATHDQKQLVAIRDKSAPPDTTTFAVYSYNIGTHSVITGEQFLLFFPEEGPSYVTTREGATKSIVSIADKLQAHLLPA